MNKENVAFVYNGLLLSYKKDIGSTMDATRDDHTKWSKSDKNIIWYYSYVKY